MGPISVIGADDVTVCAAAPQWQEITYVLFAMFAPHQVLFDVVKNNMFQSGGR